MDYHGIIILNKPLGKTSHDMIYFIRRLLGMKRVGHTGTLDPQATGVLPICIGIATKASDFIMNSDKSYITRVKLGISTDTQDADGEVISTREVCAAAGDIERVCMEFVGEIEQLPPMYSAIKIGGQKLYDLARKGIEIERKARKVTIHSIDLLHIDEIDSTFVMRVCCSKGTYVRTLANDIGEKLLCGAHVQTLERTKSGGFAIEQAYTCEELLALKESGKLADIIIKTDDVFACYEKAVVIGKEYEKVKNGVAIDKSELVDDKTYRVYSENGDFLCISTCKQGRLVMDKSFW